MKLDWKSQIIARRLEDIYRHKDSYNGVTTQFSVNRNDYSPVYDFLISDGHKIEFDKDAKKYLYNLSKKAFKREHSSWIPLKPGEDKEKHEEGLKRELEKYYKSFLVKKYLLDKFKNEGLVVKQLYEDSDGVYKEVKIIELTPKYGED